MRQRQVIKDVSEKFDLPQTQAKKIIEDFITGIKREIPEKGELELPGFGDFYLQLHKEKHAKIPGKTETVVIPSHYKLQFHTDDETKEKLQEIKKS